MMKMNTGTGFHTVKYQFGLGVAHMYDENEHREQRSTPTRIQSSNLVGTHLW
jgi:archaeosine-15-forming tRNA-guanine transglycosylase